MIRVLAVFLALVLLTIEVSAAQNLPYPVRELLRRTGDRPAQIAQMAKSYEQTAQKSGYTGSENGGAEAKRMALDMLQNLKLARAPMEHPKIVEIVNSLNNSLGIIESVSKKVQPAKASNTTAPAQAAAPAKLSYPVREALRRQAGNVKKVQAFVEQYESEAAAAGYVGQFNHGLEVAGLSDSIMRTLKGARANFQHPDIVAITNILDDAKRRVATVDSKVTTPAGIKPAPPAQSVSTQTATSTPTTSAPAQASTQAKKLPYPAREAVRRQTANITAIEKKFESAKADAAKPLSPLALIQQQMLQGMLATNPNLRAELEANPSQLNVIMAKSPHGLDGMVDQRLESAMQDLRSNRAPMGHPKVSALVKRIEGVRQGIADLQRANLNKMTAAKKANNLDDFPDFRKNIQLVKSREHMLYQAKSDIDNLNKILQKKVNSKDEFYQNPSHSIAIERLANIIDVINNKKIFAEELTRWTNKYKPVFDRNPNYKLEWQQAAKSLEKLFPIFDGFDSSLAARRFAEMYEHNDAVIREIVTNYFRKDDSNRFYGSFRDNTTQQMASLAFNEFIEPVTEIVIDSNKVIRDIISLLGEPARAQLAKVNKKKEEFGIFMQKSAGTYFANGYAYKEKIAAKRAEKKLALAEQIQKLKDEREKRWEYAHVAHDPGKYEIDFLGVSNQYNAGDRENLERATRLNMPEAGSGLEIIGYIIPSNWSENLVSEKIEVWVGEKLNSDYVILSSIGLKRYKDKRERFEVNINHSRDSTMSIELFKSLMKP